MTKPVYWGEGGEYGPYSVQEDGWPNAGEVMRAYRLKRGGVQQRWPDATVRH